MTVVFDTKEVPWSRAVLHVRDDVRPPFALYPKAGKGGKAVAALILANCAAQNLSPRSTAITSPEDLELEMLLGSELIPMAAEMEYRDDSLQGTTQMRAMNEGIKSRFSDRLGM